VGGRYTNIVVWALALSRIQERTIVLKAVVAAPRVYMPSVRCAADD